MESSGIKYFAPNDSGTAPPSQNKSHGRQNVGCNSFPTFLLQTNEGVNFSYRWPEILFWLTRLTSWL